MVQDDPIEHRLTSVAQASTSGRCEADPARLKEDPASAMKIKFGVDIGNIHYTKSHIPLNLIWFLFLLIGVFLIL